MKTILVIDDPLMAAALQATELKRLVKQQAIRELRGKLHRQSNLGEMQVYSQQ